MGRREPSADRDGGESAVSYAALLLVFAVIMTALFTSGVITMITNRVDQALCGVFQHDCAEQPVAGRPPSGSSTGSGAPQPGGIRPYWARGQGGGSPDEDWCPTPPNEVGTCGPPTGEEVLSAQPEQPEQSEHEDQPNNGEPECAATGAWYGQDGVCEEFFEVDFNWRGGRVYIYSGASELIAGPVRNLCERLADNRDEQTGRCILAFLRNFRVPEDQDGRWNKLTDGDRWEDIMDALDTVEGDGGCLAVDTSQGPRGRTNWTTRDSGNEHCRRGPDPLADFPQVGSMIDLLPENTSPQVIHDALAALPADQREDLEDVLDVDGFFGDLDDALRSRSESTVLEWDCSVIPCIPRERPLEPGDIA